MELLPFYHFCPILATCVSAPISKGTTLPVPLAEPTVEHMVLTRTCIFMIYIFGRELSGALG